MMQRFQGSVFFLAMVVITWLTCTIPLWERCYLYFKTNFTCFCLSLEFCLLPVSLSCTVYSMCVCISPGHGRLVLSSHLCIWAFTPAHLNTWNQSKLLSSNCWLRRIFPGTWIHSPTCILLVCWWHEVSCYLFGWLTTPMFLLPWAHCLQLLAGLLALTIFQMRSISCLLHFVTCSGTYSTLLSLPQSTIWIPLVVVNPTAQNSFKATTQNQNWQFKVWRIVIYYYTLLSCMLYVPRWLCEVLLKRYCYCTKSYNFIHPSV